MMLAPKGYGSALKEQAEADVEVGDMDLQCCDILADGLDLVVGGSAHTL